MADFEHPEHSIEHPEHRHLRPAPVPPPAPKHPVISRERALSVAHNTIQEIIDRSSLEPARSTLMLAQIRLKRALENL